MKWFNNLKHWQVFLLLFIMPMIISIIDNPGPSFLKNFGFIASFLLYTFWILNIALSNSQSSWFAIFCVIVLFSSFAIVTLNIDDEEFPKTIFAVITYISLFTSVLVAGKRLNSAEAELGPAQHFLANAFLILFFPAGIWFIQPRINKITNKEENSKEGF